MRLIFDFDNIPNENEVDVIVDTVKAAKVVSDELHEVHLQVNGKGPSFSINNSFSSDVDGVKEVVSAIVSEMHTELDYIDNKITAA